MKKILVLLMALLLTVALASCTGNDTPANGTEGNTTATVTDAPSDPADPSDPSDPADPADPSDPSDPSDPADEGINLKEDSNGMYFGEFDDFE